MDVAGAAALRMMVRRAGLSTSEVSRRLGRSPNWTRNVSASGRDPRLSTVAEVAGATGHRLAILDDAGAVVAYVAATPEPEPEPRPQP